MEKVNLKKNKRLILLLVGGLMTLVIFSAEKESLGSTKKVGSETTQTPTKSPLDKALIKLWQAIDVINKYVVIFKEGDEVTYLIEPRGAITNNRPIFKWTEVQDASSYRIHLYGLGNEWSAKTSAPKFVWTETEKPLLCGTYTWKVEVLKGDFEKGKFSNPTRFRIVSREEESQIEKEAQSAKELLVSGYLSIGSIYLKHLFFQEAISNFNKAIKIIPDNPYAHLGLAFAYNAIGKNKEAEKEGERAILFFKQTIKLDPDNPNLINSLAQAYKVSGKTEEAEINKP